jgi:ribonuclease P protein component
VKREQRLRSPAEFRRVRDLAGRGWPHPLLVLFVAPNDLGRTRVGITVSGRVGTAVVRNKVRRRLREAVRARFDQLPPGADLVIAARPASARATWSELNAALDAVLARVQASR